MSKFEMDGRTYDAFSGYHNQANKITQQCMKDGPIPVGSYYILDREEGGHFGAIRDWLTKMFYVDHTDWFALYRKDKHIDDYLFCDQLRRGNFRLHPKAGLGISEGCITINTLSAFEMLATQLRKKTKFKIPGTNLMAYSIVDVIALPKQQG
jgi:hypothetical protein